MATRTRSTPISQSFPIGFGAYRVIDRDGESTDPLGLRAAETVVADLLFPGFTGAQRRAKSLALYVLGVALSDECEDLEPRDAFRRFEHICIWSVALGIDGRPDNLALGGLRSARHNAPTDQRGSIEDLDKRIGLNGTAVLWGHRRLAEQLGLVSWENELSPELADEGERLVSNLRDTDECKAVLGLLKAPAGRARIRDLKPLGRWFDKTLHPTRKEWLREDLYGIRHLDTDAYYRTLRAALRLDEEGFDARKLPSAVKVPWAAAVQLGRIVAQLEDVFRGYFGVPERFSEHVGQPATVVEDLAAVAGFLSSAGPEARAALAQVEALEQLVRARGNSLTGQDLFTLHQRVLGARGRSPWSMEIKRTNRIEIEDSDEEAQVTGKGDAGDDSDAESVDARGAMLSPIPRARLKAFIAFASDIAKKGEA